MYLKISDNISNKSIRRVRSSIDKDQIGLKIELSLSDRKPKPKMFHINSSKMAPKMDFDELNEKQIEGLV